MNSIQITNEHNRKFQATVINNGDKYGNSAIHDSDKPLVEFTDITNGGKGQVVSQYYVETVLEHSENAGLRLDGGIPEWDLTAENMRDVKAILS